MTIILIRHAHRDIPTRGLGRGEDNGLSKKGREQSRRILRYFRKYLKRRFGKDTRRGRGARIRLLSSPKLRCIETLEPIARFLECEIAVSNLLLEADGESPAELSARVSRLIDRELSGHELRGRDEVVLLCSHGDWLPVALKRLCGAIAELKKGSWAEIEDGQLARLLQPEDL